MTFGLISQHYLKFAYSLWKKIPGAVLSLTYEILLLHDAKVHLLGEKGCFSLGIGTVNTQLPPALLGEGQQ